MLGVSHRSSRLRRLLLNCPVLRVCQEAICTLLFNVEAVVPYSRGDLLSRVHELGACDTEEYTDAGTYIKVTACPQAGKKAP